MVRARPDTRSRLPIPADYISEEELQKDFNYLKSGDDGLAGRGDWPTDRRGRLRDMESDLVDLKDDLTDDDKEAESAASERKSGAEAIRKGGAKEMFMNEDSKEDLKDVGREKTDQDEDEDFEQLKAISSRLQKLDEISAPKLGRRNNTGNENFHQMAEDFKLEKLQNGNADTSSMDEENLPEESKLAMFSVGKKSTEYRIENNLLQRNTTQGKRPKVYKGHTSKGWIQNTLMSTEPLAVLKRPHGRKTTQAPSANLNQSDYGFDDDSISRMIGQSGSSHVNNTSFEIVDQGMDKVDIPITGNSNWHTISHGRREVVIAGSVIAVVGILVLILAIIHALLQRRRKNKSSNANNNQRYRRLTTGDENMELLESRHSTVIMSSDEEDSDEEENDEEDTLFIRGRRKPTSEASNTR